MPKAGIEPARGFAPLDFESSASSSSATSARTTAAIVAGVGCKGAESGFIIGHLRAVLAGCQRRKQESGEEEE